MRTWINLLFLISTLSFLCSGSAQSTCANLTGTCDYYLCRENESQCGEKGYYLYFAHHYCEKYQARAHKFTSNGQIFLAKIRSCLQVKLERLEHQPVCEDVKSLAIRTHEECYKEMGYCDLKLRDRFKIQWMAKRELFDREMGEFANYLNELCYPGSSHQSNSEN